MANEYEDNLFDFEEDLEEAQKKQKTQHIVLSVLAVVVIVVALLLSIFLTNARIARQAVEKETLLAKQEAERKALDVNYWPEETFPDMPVFTATEYKTTQSAGYADVIVPPAAAAGFEEYKQGMLDDGAQLVIDTTTLVVLFYNGTEVHLVNENSGTHVVFCNEEMLDWDSSEYSAFQLPDTMVLASVAEGASAGSRVLTYRNATVADALSYVDSLVKAGWVTVNELTVSDNMFNVSLKLDSRQITVDYFSTSDNFTVRLDYLGE